MKPWHSFYLRFYWVLKLWEKWKENPSIHSFSIFASTCAHGSVGANCNCQYWVPNSPHMHVLGLYEEVIEPGESPREILQDKVLLSDSWLSCRDVLPPRFSTSSPPWPRERRHQLTPISVFMCSHLRCVIVRACARHVAAKHLVGMEVRGCRWRANYLLCSLLLFVSIVKATGANVFTGHSGGKTRQAGSDGGKNKQGSNFSHRLTLGKGLRVPWLHFKDEEIKAPHGMKWTGGFDGTVMVSKNFNVKFLCVSKENNSPVIHVHC